MKKEKDGEKVIGILGGMGPEATIDIFQKIVRLTDAKRDQDHFHIIIDNNPKIPDRTSSIENGDKRIVSYLTETAGNLERAGVDFIIIPCNTAHYYFEEIEKSVQVPIINMIKETVNQVIKANISPVGIMATIGTIRTKLYQNELKNNNIPFMLPGVNSQRNIMEAIMQIKAGNDKKLISKILYKEAKKLIKTGAKALILGCTEIPLAFPFDRIKVPVFDATIILAQSAIEFAKKNDDNKN